MGGASNLRGYRQNAFFGDNGFFLSAEIRQPILSIEKWNLDLQIAPFIDFGKVWNDRNSLQIIHRDRFSAIAFGLIFNIGNNFDARLDWAIPLDDLGQSKNNLQEKGFYFQVRYRPL
ncbi:MAG: BamA/TamA family outer membrane protein [Prochloraceae cyanobacterium]